MAKVKAVTLKVASKNFASDFDTQGSYTGVNSENIYEKPIQDADDL